MVGAGPGAGEAEGRRMVCVIAVLMLQSSLKDVGALGEPASDVWVGKGDLEDVSVSVLLFLLRLVPVLVEGWVFALLYAC